MNKLFEQYENLSKEDLQKYLYDACEKGELDKVKYLVNSPELAVHADVLCQEGQALIDAVYNNQFEIVDYLLNSDELKENINIHTCNDFAIIQACENGDTEMVKFLLTSPKLKEHSDIYTKGNHLISARPFLMAYICEQMEVLEYLILEYKIEYNDAIKYILNGDRKEITPILENMFKNREIHSELKEELNIGILKNKKLKL